MIQIDYILRRIAFSLMTLAAVIVFNFFLFRIIPGDPVAMISSPRMKPETRDLIREQYGLDKPVWLNITAVREEKQISAILIASFSTI